MSLFDYGELDNRLAETNARLECLSCGGTNVKHAHRKIGLVEVAENGRVEIHPTAGTALVVFCAPRICDDCGYVHLYSAAAIDRSRG